MSAALDAVGKILCVGGGLLVMAWIVISLCVIAARADRRMEKMEEDETAQPVNLGAEGYGSEYSNTPTLDVVMARLRSDLGNAYRTLNEIEPGEVIDGETRPAIIRRIAEMETRISGYQDRFGPDAGKMGDYVHIRRGK